jgi:dTDP-glucose 4,6-dehydratase
VIARGFTFGGPGTPARSKFAIGNFIQDVLEGKPIVVKGDGTPIRSYMYGADLAVWLWTLLAKGRAGRAYNVGSEREVSILSLAEAVSAQIGKQRVEILCPANPRGPTERYVPSTQRARDELHLKENFELHQIIRKTVAWERSLLKH